MGNTFVLIWLLVSFRVGRLAKAARNSLYLYEWLTSGSLQW